MAQSAGVGATERTLEAAAEVGFDLAGVAPCAPPPDAPRFEAWLDAGHHAGLDYLAAERARIVDPRRVLAAGRSIVMVGLAHSRPAFRLADGGRIARYAAGRDYHNVVGEKLLKLARLLQREGLVRERRRVVDAGPLLERSHAARAALGFPSKAANLLHPEFGPWFFLGALIVDAELEPASAPAAGSCGSCRACIDACPTGAIREPGLVDAGDCISYQTIENPGPVPHALRGSIAAWAFGCDICSEVCPWGRSSPDLGARFGTHRALEAATLIDLLLDRDDTRWNGSPLQRPKRAGRARNAAIALGNVPSDRGRDALLAVLTVDHEPLVREAAAWALAHAHRDDGGVRNAVLAALEREPDGDARAGMRRTVETELAPRSTV
ncbi:MAG: tRNA epoxyqueuosine(34) reductase QueG [Planctomycetes bacterium]|nr:tRNA epoxyqueuosine(34) reductase QueG [Planctomycetota bacterium]